MKFYFLLAFIVLSLSSCISSNEESSSMSSSIVGTWTMDDDGNPESYKINYLTYNSDGTMIYERFYRENMPASAFYNNGVYFIDGENLKVTLLEGYEYSGGVWHKDAQDTPDAYPIEVPPSTFSVEGDQLTLTFPEGSHVYTRADNHPVRSN